MSLRKSTVLVLARLTFLEASRRWVLWAALLMGIAFLIVYAIGFNEVFKDVVRSTPSSQTMFTNEVNNFFTVAGLYAVNFLAVIMAVLCSVDTLSGEIASGTIQTLVSKPVRRWEILMGKWLGFTVMLTLYLLLMAGGVILIVKLISGYDVPNTWRGLGLMWLNVILLLSVSLLGGTSLSTLANGVLVFGMYGIAFIGGWIEQIGSFLKSETAVNIGILSSLIIPSEALWRRAAFEMQTPLASALGMTPFSTTSVPSMLMVGYACVYLLVMLGLAIRQFYRRDL